jgi:hypothetical protein
MPTHNGGPHVSMIALSCLFLLLSVAVLLMFVHLMNFTHIRSPSLFFFADEQGKKYILSDS